MKIRDFPYDTQTCLIWFAPWVYPVSQVLPVIEPPTSAVSMELAGNSEWEIVSFVPFERFSNSSDGETYKELNFALTIKRNHVYYIAVMIIPTFVITTLCLLGIFSPFNNKAEREEKVSLGLTTLLTISVILNIVATEMPKASKLPLLGEWIEEQRYDKFQEDLWSEIFDSIDLVCLVVLEVANVILSALLML
uniref:Neurotransmitter-gated ion-channel ligand-binding domain-containing protein n=1 Tax=Plectus sambesii TaxID=2011161 RepID=A0A914WIS6_9BILA